MRSYKEEYQYWLDSPALDEEEWKELSAIADDDKEIESRFYAPLEFGTAGPARHHGHRPQPHERTCDTLGHTGFRRGYKWPRDRKPATRA